MLTIATKLDILDKLQSVIQGEQNVWALLGEHYNYFKDFQAPIPPEMVDIFK